MDDFKFLRGAIISFANLHRSLAARVEFRNSVNLPMSPFAAVNGLPHDRVSGDSAIIFYGCRRDRTRLLCIQTDEIRGKEILNLKICTYTYSAPMSTGLYFLWYVQ